MFDGKTCHVCTQLEHVFFVRRRYNGVFVDIVNYNQREPKRTIFDACCV